MNAEALGLRPAGCQATQPRPTLCSPPDGSPPGSSVREILQARMLAWVPFSRGPCLRGGPVSCVPGLAGGLSSTSAPARRFAAAEICVKKLQDSASALHASPVSLCLSQGIFSGPKLWIRSAEGTRGSAESAPRRSAALGTACAPPARLPRSTLGHLNSHFPERGLDALGEDVDAVLPGHT